MRNLSRARFANCSMILSELVSDGVCKLEVESAFFNVSAAVIPRHFFPDLRYNPRMQRKNPAHKLHSPVYIAYTHIGSNPCYISINNEDRRRHVYTVGASGMGKTTMLLSMIRQDLLAGRGLGVIDPHGDLAKEVLEHVPRSRIQDVVYLNAGDIDFPISLNVFKNAEGNPPFLLAEEIISITKSLWADSWGPRMEHVFRHALLAVLEYPEATFITLERILTDDDYRRKVLGRVTDEKVLYYFATQFNGISKRDRDEYAQPVLNKIGAFTAHEALRNILTQHNCSVNFTDIMDNRKIFIANLAKGFIGEDAANLLGSLIVSKFMLTAMSRAKLPEEERRDFYLYVDEFHNFTTRSFQSILSEARKYHLCLHLAHQSLSQLPEALRHAVLINSGTKVIFSTSSDDAKRFAGMIRDNLPPNDLETMEKFEIWYRLANEGAAAQFQRAKTIPPGFIPVPKTTRETVQLIIDESRRKYALPCSNVREIIRSQLMRVLKD